MPPTRLSSRQFASRLAAGALHYFNSPRVRDLIALTFILACALIFFQDAVLNGRIFYEFDTPSYYYPVTAWVDRALEQGRMPLWSPYIYGGFPLFADGESGALYPPNLAMLAVATARDAMVWGPLLRFFLAGAFTYGFVRVLGLSRAGAVLSGLIFAFGSFMVTQLHHANVGNAAAWLPAVLLCAELALQRAGRERLLWATVGGLAFGLQILTIHLQPVLMTSAVVGSYLVWRSILPHPDRTRTLGRRLLGGVGIGGIIAAIGLGIGAVQILPMIELSTQAARGSSANYGFATSYAPALSDLVTLIFPYFFQLNGYDFWTRWFRWETTIYVGIAPLLLTVVAMALRRGWTTLFFAVMVVVSTLLALGENAPLNLHWLLWHVPGFSFARAPGRFSMLTVFGIAVLAAIGMEELRARLRCERHVGADRFVATTKKAGWLAGFARSAKGAFSASPIPIVVASGSLAAIGLFVALILFRDWLIGNKAPAVDLLSKAYLGLHRQEGIRLPADQVYGALLNSVDWHNGRTFFSFVLLFATLALLALWYRFRGPSAIWKTMLVSIVAGDLLSFGMAYHPQIDLSTLEKRDGVAQFLAQRGGLDRAFSQQPSSVSPNRLLPLRVSTIGGYSSLNERRYTDYLQAIRRGNTALLDLFNVHYVVSPRQGPPPGPDSEFRPVFEDGGNVVYENTDYLPRAFVVARGRPVGKPADALRIITSAEFNPRAEVVLESGDEGILLTDEQNVQGPSGEQTDRAQVGAQITSYASTEVSISATAPKAAYLLLADKFYPGWTATMDGHPTSIYRADYLFRAIALPPGSHIVTFRYDPISFRTGASISITTIAIVLGMLGAYWLRRRLESIASSGARVGRPEPA